MATSKKFVVKNGLEANDASTFNGNVDVVGTVNGRDIATDGTKLDGIETKIDGIETGATADQTAAEILTAIKTVDGTGSGLDADLLQGDSKSTILASATTTSIIYAIALG